MHKNRITLLPPIRLSKSGGPCLQPGWLGLAWFGWLGLAWFGLLWLGLVGLALVWLQFGFGVVWLWFGMAVALVWLGFGLHQEDIVFSGIDDNVFL